MFEENFSGKENSVPGKKTYVKPRLEIYGDMRELTQTLGVGDGNDGGLTLSLNKTALLAL